MKTVECIDIIKNYKGETIQYCLMDNNGYVSTCFGSVLIKSVAQGELQITNGSIGSDGELSIDLNKKVYSEISLDLLLDIKVLHYLEDKTLIFEEREDFELLLSRVRAIGNPSGLYNSNGNCIVICKGNTIRVIGYKFYYRHNFNGDPFALTVDKLIFNMHKIYNTELDDLFKNITANELDISKLDMSHIKSTSEMFAMATIKNLKVGKFNTCNVVRMGKMFSGSHIDNLNEVLQVIDTSSCELMALMFYDIQADSLDVSKLDTSSAVYMDGMFGYLRLNNTLDLSNFNTSKVVSIRDMFNSANIEICGLENFDTKNLTDVTRAFKRIKIDNLDLSHWDTSKMFTLSELFSGATIDNLHINFNKIGKNSNVESMFMFTTVHNLIIDNMNFSTATHDTNIFAGLNVESLKVNGVIQYNKKLGSQSNIAVGITGHLNELEGKIVGA